MSVQPSRNASVHAARLIDERCDQFERAWLASERPQIEAFVGNVAAESRRRLIEELLLLEVFYRRQQGESVIADEYALRFQDLPQATLQQIIDRGQRHPSDRGSTPGDAPTIAGGAAGDYDGYRVRYFGDYELLEQIARGGMGVVYKARQVSLNRWVAVKMILSGQFASEVEVKRFYSEAESAAQLDHPSIVSIYEVGEHEGHHFFSMALVEGTSLAARLNEGPLEPRAAAELLRQVALAIEYAHSKGVIHRDLKPSNILLDAKDRPRVTDFGLAKRVSSLEALTITGDVLGTPSYMPPEQAAGSIDAVGPVSDVYALGAVLYALLSGRPPFQAASSIDTLRQVVDQEPVPLRQLNAAIPRDLETIVAKCLEKSLPRRYASAQELADELTRFLAGQPIRARPISRPERLWRWCHRNPWVAGSSAVAAFLLIATAAVSWAAYLREANLRGQLMTSLEQQKTLTAQETTAKQAAVAARKEEAAAKSREQIERVNATREANLARQRAKELARTAYNSDMNRIETFARDGDFAPIDAFLRRHIPHSPEDEDLRGYEWRYWWHKTHQEVASISFPTTAEKLALSDDGELLVVGCVGGLAYVLKADTLEQLPYSLKVDSEHWGALQFLTGTHVVFGAGWNGAYRGWDLSEKNIMAQGAGLNDQLGWFYLRHAAAISPSGAWLFLPRERAVASFLQSAQHEAMPCQALSSGTYIVQMSGASGSKTPIATNMLCNVVCSPIDNKWIGTLSVMPNGTPYSGEGVADITQWPKERWGAPCFGASFAPNSEWFCGGHRAGTIHLYQAPFQEQTRSWSGHKGIVWSTAFSPSAELIATGGDDGQAIMWKAATGEQVAAAPKQSGGIRTVRLVSESRLLYAGEDGVVCEWNFENQGKPRELRGHQGAVLDLVAQDSGKIFSVGIDKTLRVWNPGSPLQPFTTPNEISPGVLCVSADGRTLLGASYLGGAHLWDVESSEYLGRLDGTQVSTSYKGLALSPRGEYAALTNMGIDGVRLFDCKTLNQIAALPSQKLISHGGGKVSLPGLYHDVAFSHDSKLVAGVRTGTDAYEGGLTYGTTIEILNVANGKPHASLRVSKSADLAWRVVFSKDDKKLLTLYQTLFSGKELARGVLHLCDVESGEKLARFEMDPGVTPIAADLSPDGSLFAVLTNADRQDKDSKRFLFVWNVDSLKLYRMFELGSAVRGLVFTPDGRKLLVPLAESKGYVCDLEAETVGQVEGIPDFSNMFNDQYTGSLFAGGRLLTCRFDGMKAFRWPGFEAAESFRVPGRPVLALSVDQDKKGIATLLGAERAYARAKPSRWTWEGKPNDVKLGRPMRMASLATLGLDLRQIATLQPRLVATLVGGQAQSVIEETNYPAAEFPDRSGIALSLGKAISLWKRDGDGRLQIEFIVAADCRAVACDPRGERIVYGDGKTIKVRSLTGMIDSLGEHEQNVKSLDWSPNGQWIASAGEEGEVRIWRTDKLEQTPTIVSRSEEKVMTVLFAPDSCSVVLGLSDGRIAFVDPVTGEIRCKLAAHRGAVRAIDFSEDGSLLVTGGDDGFIRPHVADVMQKISAAHASVGRLSADVQPIDQYPKPSRQAERELAIAKEFLQAGFTVTVSHFDGRTMLIPEQPEPDLKGEVRIVAIKDKGHTFGSNKTWEPKPMRELPPLSDLHDLQELRELVIVRRKLTPENWKSFRAPPALNTLDISECELWDFPLENISAAVHLQNLLLSEGRFPAADWKLLAGFAELKSLHLSGARLDDVAFAQLAALQALETLILPQADFMGDFSWESLKKLQTLDAKGSNLADAALASLAKCPQLQLLDLTGTPASFDAILNFGEERFTTQIICSPELGADRWEERALLFCMVSPAVFSGNVVTIAQGRELLEKGEHFTRLTYPRAFVGQLAIPQQLSRPMSPTPVVHENDVQMLAALPEVKDLHLNQVFSDEQLAAILKNKSLESLAIQFPPGEVGMEAISKQAELATLQLGKGLSNSALVGHLASLAKLRSLKSQGEVSLAAIATHCPGLVSLELRSGTLQPGELKQLARIQGLRKLKIYSVPITDAELLELAEAKQLTEIDLSNTKTTSKGRAQLRKLLPKCKID